jgi:hypothetical protein
MSSGKKKTAGEAALGAAAKNETIDAIEMQREVHKGSNSKKSYEEEVWECVDRGRNDPSIEKNFYVVCLFKKERLLQNIIRQYFFYRQSCPTPEYDQTVYKYFRDGDKIEYLWTVPNNAACLFLPIALKNGELPKEHETLAYMAEAFMNGDLDKYAAKLNGEWT